LLLGESTSKVAAMDLNSRIFDRIRVKPAPQEPQPSTTRCDHPGCQAPGLYRAPMGRDREGQYFSFCMDHVREYNASYDYFRGMDDEAMIKYQKDEVVGHRPTWSMGARRGAQPGADRVDATVFAEARVYRRRGVRPMDASPPRYNSLALKALATLELNASADEPAIKARYKELVKRHHPDANGGDRSSEDKLREIIQAYNYLRANKLV
jgi:DnaJ-domain-containing protein 1